MANLLTPSKKISLKRSMQIWVGWIVLIKTSTCTAFASTGIARNPGAHGQGTVRGTQTNVVSWVHFGWGPLDIVHIIATSLICPILVNLTMQNAMGAIQEDPCLCHGSSGPPYFAPDA